MKKIAFQLKTMPNISKNEIVKDILRVDKIINKSKLTKNDYSKFSRVSKNTVSKYFGSWHNALVDAGLENKSNKKTLSRKLKKQQGKFMSDNEIINELKKTAKKIGKNSITATELDKNSKIISYSTVRNRFGWQKALKIAGLKLSSLGKRYSNQECFENLLNVWTFYKRQPKGSEMNKKPSIVGLKAYTDRWGSWNASLEAFVNEVNKDISQSDSTKIPSFPKVSNNYRKRKTILKDEDRREIKMGLRYKILSKDNFKCIICGNSPATDPTCKLHIDHIIPFSKGGKTTIKNLRTLCNKCNIGKSNKQ